MKLMWLIEVEIGDQGTPEICLLLPVYLLYSIL